MATTPNPATAGNVSQQPNPELLRRFEEERDAAQAELDRAAALRKDAEERRARAERMKEKAHEEAVKELCAIGALPPEECH